MLFSHTHWTLVPAALYALTLLVGGMLMVCNAVVREERQAVAGRPAVGRRPAERGRRRRGGRRLVRLAVPAAGGQCWAKTTTFFSAAP